MEISRTNADLGPSSLRQSYSITSADPQPCTHTHTHTWKGTLCLHSSLAHSCMHIDVICVYTHVQRFTCILCIGDIFSPEWVLPSAFPVLLSKRAKRSWIVFCGWFITTLASVFFSNGKSPDLWKVILTGQVSSQMILATDLEANEQYNYHPKCPFITSSCMVRPTVLTLVCT